MFCSHCGKELREGAAFCVHCGVSVGQTARFSELPRRPHASDGKAIASLICGIISLITFGGLLILPTIGLLFGILGLKSRQSGVAVAGICLNVIAFTWCALLVALLIPSVSAAREGARRMQCANYEKQMGLAFHCYHDRYGALPPLYTVDEEGKPLHSWRVLLLPYIEQQALYEQIRLDEPWDSDHNKQFHDQMPYIYKCPSSPGDRRKGCTYSAIAGWSFVPAKEAGSVLGLNFWDFTDGLSNTLALVEVKEPFNWMDPTADVSLDDVALGNRVGSYHANTNVIVLHMDGRVIAIAPTQLQRMAAREVDMKTRGKE